MLKYKCPMPIMNPDDGAGASGGGADDSAKVDNPAGDTGEGDTKDEGGEGTKDDGASDDDEKVYSKKDVQKMVNERIQRLNKKHQDEVASLKEQYKDYDDLKEIDSLIAEFQYGDTTQARKDSIKKQLNTIKEDQWREEAEAAGKDPDLYVENKRLQEQLDKEKASKAKVDKEKAIEERRKEAQQTLNKQIKELEEHRKVSFDDLKKNEKFVKFFKASDPQMSVIDVYDLFVEMVGDPNTKDTKDEDEGKDDDLEAYIEAQAKKNKSVAGKGSPPAKPVTTPKTFDEARAGAFAILKGEKK